MIKKLLFLLLALTCGAYVSFSYEDKKLDLRTVQLSKAQWQSVQSQVSTNGYCYIKDQNVMLVITNGLPNIDVIHWMPIGRGPEKKDKRRCEPVPYVGQGGW